MGTYIGLGILAAIIGGMWLITRALESFAKDKKTPHQH